MGGGREREGGESEAGRGGGKEGEIEGGRENKGRPKKEGKEGVKRVIFRPAAVPCLSPLDSFLKA